MNSTRTIRRYAHEIYPLHHEDIGEIRPLAMDVPYLYARAIGLSVRGTGWLDAEGGKAGDRISMLIAAGETALIADALLQGLAGDEAWKWARERSNDETGEWVWERAMHYSVDVRHIKPYPCGPEPEQHEHLTQESEGVWSSKYAQCRESECPDCTEPVPAEETSHE